MNRHVVEMLKASRDEGVTCEEAWPRRVSAALGDVDAPVLGGEDLRAAKRAAGRLKDLADLEELG